MVRWLLILLLLSSPVFAADTAVPTAVAVATPMTAPSLLTSSLKMVAGLGVVAGIMLLIYAASRKGFGVLPQKKNGLIKVLETRPLGGRKFLCVVKVRDEEMLLGLSNDRIEYLAKVPSNDKFATTLEQAEVEQS